MIVGYTGTQRGMTDAQKKTVIELLKKCRESDNDNVFRHGNCIGGDEEAAWIAASLGYGPIIAHPGDTPDKQSNLNRYDEILPVEPNLKRNKTIVKKSQVMIACPYELYEVTRSGTWATIRYCKKQSKMLYLVLPDGRVLIL